MTGLRMQKRCARGVDDLMGPCADEGHNMRVAAGSQHINLCHKLLGAVGRVCGLGLEQLDGYQVYTIQYCTIDL